MIKDWENLNTTATLTEQFFPKSVFYSSLKKSNISDKEYEDVEKMFKLLKMSNLSDLNALYNFQDTIILIEIFENNSQKIQEKFNFNLRKCSSAITLSGAIQRDMSKVIISFPTNAHMIELMEKSLTGGMSVVNTRVGFDSNLFLNNENQKLVYEIRNQKSNEIENKRVSTVIWKIDENNQQGNAMTKPLLVESVKIEACTLNHRELLLLLQRISHDGKIGHLFVVDLEFNTNKGTEK